MSHRRSAAVLAVALLGCSQEPSVEPASRPDLILITIDTLRADALGCYGRDEARTPNMDRLAAEGARFKYAYAPRGATLPSLTTVMTGVSPLSHGVIGNNYAMLTKQPNLAQNLKEAGYSTACVMTNQCEMVVNMDDHIGQGFDRRICAKTDTHFQYEWDIKATDEGIRWLEEAPDGPTFLWVHLMDPHGSHFPDMQYYRSDIDPTPLLTDQTEQLARYEQDDVDPPADMMERLWALYDAEVEGADVQVGRLVDAALKRRPGVRPAIILTGDHGEEFYLHNNFRGHGDSIYDVVLRVPLILWGPHQGVPAGVVPTYFAELEDIAPTAYDLVDVKPRIRVQGQTLIPFLEKNLDREAGFGAAYGIWGEDVLTVRKPRYRFVWNRAPGEQEFVDQHAYRSRFDFFRKKELLFDTSVDPDEQDDLLDDEEVSSTASALRKGLKEEVFKWSKAFRQQSFAEVDNDAVNAELRQAGLPRRQHRRPQAAQDRGRPRRRIVDAGARDVTIRR